MFLVDWWRVAATVDSQGGHRMSLGGDRGIEGRSQTATGQAMTPIASTRKIKRVRCFSFTSNAFVNQELSRKKDFYNKWRFK